MKRIVFVCLMILLCQDLYSSPGAPGLSENWSKPRKKKSAFDRSRVLFGPNLGFGAGSRSFSLNIAPSIAYCLTDHLYAGTTLGFSYYQEAFDYQNALTGQRETFRFKIPAYSFSVYARYLIGNFLILNAEPELNWTKFVSQPTYDLQTGKLKDNSVRLFVPSVLVGAGYTQRFNSYSHTYLMILYDLVQNPNSRYYQTLDFRFGIMLNLWN